jgi:hypothetical protein
MHHFLPTQASVVMELMRVTAIPCSQVCCARRVGGDGMGCITLLLCAGG